MRLWDYRLIPVLPKKMLVSQWRECIAIKRQWEKGTLKHRLVSYVQLHPKHQFLGYVREITKELDNRQIKYNYKYYEEIEDFSIYLVEPTTYYKEHNDRYLKQCYYNLQEKADRGIITQEEWEKIDNLYKKIIKEG